MEMLGRLSRRRPSLKCGMRTGTSCRRQEWSPWLACSPPAGPSRTVSPTYMRTRISQCPIFFTAPLLFRETACNICWDLSNGVFLFASRPQHHRLLRQRSELVWKLLLDLVSWEHPSASLCNNHFRSQFVEFIPQRLHLELSNHTNQTGVKWLFAVTVHTGIFYLNIS